VVGAILAASLLGPPGRVGAEDDSGAILPDYEELCSLEDIEVAGAAGELLAAVYVQSAAKRVETVQESAVIVTVLTRAQIQARGYLALTDLLDDLPGFEGYRPYVGGAGLEIETLARGHQRTILVLWNGTPLADPISWDNLTDQLPLSLVDRVEIVSGPGGVLWGANAFLGIVSVTTLRASTMPDRVTAEIHAGGGSGRQSTYRATASFADRLWHDRLEAFVHLAYDTSLGSEIGFPYDVVSVPFSPPDNDSAFVMRPLSGLTRNARDHFLSLAVALDVGPARFDLLVPLVYHERFEIAINGKRTDQYLSAGGTIEPGLSSSRRRGALLASVTVERPLGTQGGLVGRAYYTAFQADDALVAFAPGELGEEPVVNNLFPADTSPLFADASGRLGLATDAWRSSLRHHLLGGAEAYLEYARELRSEVVGAFTEPPFPVRNAGRRLVLAAFVNDQMWLAPTVRASAGLRAQIAPGAYAPLVLGSASFLWNPWRKLYAKLNIAQGFRPPPFAETLVNDDPATNPLPHVGGNPDLTAERSLAVEGEVSAIVLRGTGGFRHVAVRGGYQLTRLDDLIGPKDNLAVNRAQRFLHSAEARADFALAGGHEFVLAGGFFFGRDRDDGPLRHVANLKLHAGGTFRLTARVLGSVRATLYGRREDLNRLPIAGTAEVLTAPASSVVIDRLPPAAVVSAGLLARDLGSQRLELGLHVQNALDGHALLPDPTYDKRVRPLPFLAPGISAFLTLSGRL
jgi:hypothetical protein